MIVSAWMYTYCLPIPTIPTAWDAESWAILGIANSSLNPHAVDTIPWGHENASVWMQLGTAETALSVKEQ
jgi:hypothetical protein